MPGTKARSNINAALCRTIFAPVASAMTCVVAMLSAFTNLRWLLGCAMAFGFVFGWHWSLMPVIRSCHQYIKPNCIMQEYCLLGRGSHTSS